MKQIKRSEVPVGKTFYVAGDTDHPCIALDPQQLNYSLKKKYWGEAGKLWHLYVPTGQIAWMDPDRDALVYVEAPTATYADPATNYGATISIDEERRSVEICTSSGYKFRCDVYSRGDMRQFILSCADLFSTDSPIRRWLTEQAATIS